jgi:hypothetical protein
MTIKINPNPSVDIGLADSCAATAHLHATVTGGKAPYTFSWKKNGVAVGSNSADLALTGPGTYTVSVTDSSATSCPSNTDTFVVCYTEAPSASAPAVQAPKSVDVALKPGSRVSVFLAQVAFMIYSGFGFVTL